MAPREEAYVRFCERALERAAAPSNTLQHTATYIENQRENSWVAPRDRAYFRFGEREQPRPARHCNTLQHTATNTPNRRTPSPLLHAQRTSSGSFFVNFICRCVRALTHTSTQREYVAVCCSVLQCVAGSSDHEFRLQSYTNTHTHTHTLSLSHTQQNGNASATYIKG